ncbi:MAG: alcohol dehydrogenase catalytic domain-containing protein, partial [Rickettsiales bacterium]|nr:alcohol dehydrogenase catalytic domain-containing protein [Rickettsiales bacterium]
MTYAYAITKNGDPDVLTRIDTSMPQPAKGEVLIRNHAGAVNYIDTIIRRGEMPEGMMPSLPHVPGVEGAGIVEALGEGVDQFAVGDRVAWMGPMGAGGYGTYSVISATYIAKISDN